MRCYNRADCTHLPVAAEAVCLQRKHAHVWREPKSYVLEPEVPISAREPKFRRKFPGS